MNALVRGTELLEKVLPRMHLILAFRPKMMFGIVLEHLVDPRHEKLYKTCVPGLNALFRGTKLLEIVLPRYHPI